MGLNGRKPKQRIGNDPRNLSWADDAARFGINYLSKFGWNSSRGLGASGEGRKSHLDVSKKLDMLGIGAAHQLDPNGIAWKQNKDFENLLKRLNGDVIEGSAVEGFRKADMDGVGEEQNDVQDEEKKRERDDSKDTRKKKRKKIGKDEEDPQTVEAINLPSEREAASSVSSERRRTTPTLPRHRAHRARAIAAKNLSSKSAVHISEILGVAPTPLSTTATFAGQISGTNTPQDVELASDTLEIERITTSRKSMHDYFKEKLQTKKSLTLVNPPVSAVDHIERALSHDTPRGGLGSSSQMAFGPSTLSSFLAAAREPLLRDASSHTDAVETEMEESVATPDRVKVKKKKRSKVTDEQKTSESLASDGNTKRQAKITVAGEDISANLTTKKKKGGKREKHIRD